MVWAQPNVLKGLIIILQSLFSGDPTTIMMNILASIVVVFTALPIHEVAHGYIANKLGDPTAKNMGRLNLNPLAHFDPIGTTALLLFGFGWAKPVPVNPYYFKNRKNGMALTALAGPVSNILLATICLAIGKIIANFLPYSQFTMILIQVLNIIISINVMLAAFNLIPIPPLDGSKIIAIFMPMHVYARIENWFARYQQYFLYAMMGILFILPRLGGPFAAISNIIYIPLSLLQNLIFKMMDFLTGFIDIIGKII
ncbi:MAG: site-2 protease family protein [Oscillospiraceae bacterium]